LDGLLGDPAHTARVEELGIEVGPTIQLNNFLVERSFGRLDGERIYTYAYVWPLDKFNVTHTAFDVESVAAVCHRIRTLIVDQLEEQYANCHLVLTSHADVLQIAQLYASKPEAVGYFSSYRFASECWCSVSGEFIHCNL
jgi:broad specificity phosphatase PhoE